MNQQKRNLTLLISLLGLCMLVVILFVTMSTPTEEIDPEHFRLTDSKAVNKVIFRRDSSILKLEFTSGRWTVNDSFPADRGLVDVLFATMARAIPKRAAAARVRDSVIQQTQKLGVQVDFYVGADVDRSIWVWGDEDRNVTYFIDNQEDTPYVMTIPGYRVLVGGIFVQQLGTWRDKRIFNFNWRNFNSLDATFPNDPAQNFRASLVDRFFSIEGLNNVDTTALNNYLDAASLIEGDEFYLSGDSPIADSLITTKPICILSVTEASGRIHTLKVFPIGRGERRALAQWGTDYVWFDRRNILQVYKKRKDFIKQ